jgi:hypothetical protein
MIPIHPQSKASYTRFCACSIIYSARSAYIVRLSWNFVCVKGIGSCGQTNPLIFHVCKRIISQIMTESPDQTQEPIYVSLPILYLYKPISTCSAPDSESKCHACGLQTNGSHGNIKPCSTPVRLKKQKLRWCCWLRHSHRAVFAQFTGAHVAPKFQ